MHSSKCSHRGWGSPRRQIHSRGELLPKPRKRRGPSPLRTQSRRRRRPRRARANPLRNLQRQGPPERAIRVSRIWLIPHSHRSRVRPRLRTTSKGKPLLRRPSAQRARLDLAVPPRCRGGPCGESPCRTRPLVFFYTRYPGARARSSLVRFDSPYLRPVCKRANKSPRAGGSA